MTTVLVRENRQITIPSDIGKLAGIEPNDVLEIEVTAQGIFLRPIHKDQQGRLDKLMKFAGSGQALVDKENPDFTIKQLREDRDAWTY